MTTISGPAQEATLAAWLIHAPGQSPAWSDYLLSLIHLRDIDGANQILEKAVWAVCQGILPAEPPFPRQGQALWKRAIQETAAHVVLGLHPS